MASDTEKEIGRDILGRKIIPGDVITFCSSGAQLDVGIVTRVVHASNGSLMGYDIVYPFLPKSYEVGKHDMVNKKKRIRSAREVLVLPASQLGGLASGQARRTQAFAGRLQYLREQVLKGYPVEDKK